MSSTTRAFFLVAWDMGRSPTKLIGPFESRQVAYDCLADGVAEDLLDYDASGIIGPVPFEQLREGGEWTGKTVEEHLKLFRTLDLRPSEMIALAHSLSINDGDDQNKLEALKLVYTDATGEDMPAPPEPLVDPETSRAVMADWGARQVARNATQTWATFKTTQANANHLQADPKSAKAPELAFQFDDQPKEVHGVYEWIGNIEAPSAEAALQQLADNDYPAPGEGFTYVAFPIPTA